jgi:hypothetical protein
MGSDNVAWGNAQERETSYFFQLSWGVAPGYVVPAFQAENRRNSQIAQLQKLEAGLSERDTITEPTHQLLPHGWPDDRAG